NLLTADSRTRSPALGPATPGTAPRPLPSGPATPRIRVSHGQPFQARRTFEQRLLPVTGSAVTGSGWGAPDLEAPPPFFVRMALAAVPEGRSDSSLPPESGSDGENSASGGTCCGSAGAHGPGVGALFARPGEEKRQRWRFLRQPRG